MAASCGRFTSLPDALPADGVLPRRIRQVGLSEPGDDVSINHAKDPNLTVRSSPT
jgi:hypothetical protein